MPSPASRVLHQACRQAASGPLAAALSTEAVCVRNQSYQFFLKRNTSILPPRWRIGSESLVKAAPSLQWTSKPAEHAAPSCELEMAAKTATAAAAAAAAQLRRCEPTQAQLFSILSYNIRPQTMKAAFNPSCGCRVGRLTACAAKRLPGQQQSGSDWFLHAEHFYSVFNCLNLRPATNRATLIGSVCGPSPKP